METLKILARSASEWFAKLAQSASYDVGRLGLFATRSASEGKIYVAYVTLADNPSLTRQVMKNIANRHRFRSKALKAQAIGFGRKGITCLRFVLVSIVLANNSFR